jgi:hypothetical protein
MQGVLNFFRSSDYIVKEGEGDRGRRNFHISPPTHITLYTTAQSAGNGLTLKIDYHVHWRLAPSAAFSVPD